MTTHRRALLKKLWVLSLLIYCLLGCAVDQGKVYEKEGKKYGVTPEMTWRGRWWDHYQRGNSYADGEFWQEAIADFQAAIMQRENDQRQARTYGLHFLDYFAHRDLGIVYYRLNRYPEAIAELESSLQSVDSAKAKFYLNRARKAVLERSGRDTAPPRIVFESPDDGLLTNRFTIRVTGQAEDDSYVSGVSINGRELFIELAQPRMAFDREINLDDGANTIEVVAKDLIGRSNRQKITVHVDRQGPLVGVDKVEVLGEPSQQRARVQGFISDRSRITRLLIGQSSVPVPPQSEWEFDREVPLAAGIKFLPFEVEDAAGNITVGQISLASSTGEPTRIRLGKLTMPLWPLCTFLPPLTMVTDPLAFRPAAIQTAQQSHQIPPFIKLKELGAEQTVYVNTIYLEGQVTDDRAVTAFWINKEIIWRREIRQMYFGHFVSLKPGANRFELVAHDKDGHETREVILVTYVIPEIEQPDSRLRVGLLPFKKTGETSVLGDQVYDDFYHALVNQERFQMVEREKLKEILSEQKLSQTPLVDKATAVQVGKIAAAEGMLIGSVTEKPPELTVKARFIDLESTDALFSVDVYDENPDLKLIDFERLMQGLAGKLKQRFPIVVGKILKIKDSVITINLTKKHGIKKQMKLILFRDGEKLKDPDTGEILQDQEILGEARITRVGGVGVASKASLLQPEIADTLEVLDKVVTK